MKKDQTMTDPDTKALEARCELDFYLSDAENGICRVPRAVLSKWTQERATLRQERDEARAERDASDISAAEVALAEYHEKGGTPLSELMNELADLDGMELAEHWQSRAESAEAEASTLRQKLERAEAKRDAALAEPKYSVGDWSTQRENDLVTIEKYEWKDRADRLTALLAETGKVLEPVCSVAAVIPPGCRNDSFEPIMVRTIRAIAVLYAKIKEATDAR